MPELIAYKQVRKVICQTAKELRLPNWSHLQPSQGDLPGYTDKRRGHRKKAIRFVGCDPHDGIEQLLHHVSKKTEWQVAKIPSPTVPGATDYSLFTRVPDESWKEVLEHN